MAIETLFRYIGKEKGDENFLIEKLKKFEHFYTEDIEQYTIIFCGKHIWGHYFIDEYSDSQYNYFDVKYESLFKNNYKEIHNFIEIMLSLGFEVDNGESREQIESREKTTPPIYKTHLGRSFTKEEWEAYEAEEYKKYIDKRNKKTNSLFVEENPPQDFALETNGLREIKHFVMNSRSEQVTVYQYPSTMVAPITFLPNGTVVEVLKKGDDGWCEVLSKDRKKGFIQSNFVKEN